MSKKAPYSPPYLRDYVEWMLVGSLLCESASEPMQLHLPGVQCGRDLLTCSATKTEAKCMYCIVLDLIYGKENKFLKLVLRIVHAALMKYG